MWRTIQLKFSALSNKEHQWKNSSVHHVQNSDFFRLSTDIIWRGFLLFDCSSPRWSSENSSHNNNKKPSRVLKSTCQPQLPSKARWNEARKCLNYVFTPTIALWYTQKALNAHTRALDCLTTLTWVVSRKLRNKLKTQLLFLRLNGILMVQTLRKFWIVSR